jgi:hypothetical protein
MAIANLNKSEELVINTTEALRYIPGSESALFEIPLSDPDLLIKSTSKCKHCEVRFTS